jgi:hypothetical protein
MTSATSAAPQAAQRDAFQDQTDVDGAHGSYPPTRLRHVSTEPLAPRENVERMRQDGTEALGAPTAIDTPAAARTLIDPP